MRLSWLRSVAPISVALGLFAVVHFATHRAEAQVNPGFHRLFQKGVEVGVIFAPSRSSSARYVEHWILYKGYVYPGQEGAAAVEIRPDGQVTYSSEADFFKRTRWEPGFRYVRVDASESTTLPGR